jgi:hypothetical protein
MKDEVEAVRLSFILHPSAFILKKPRGAPSPVHAPRPWARRIGADAELRTSPAPSARNYPHPENSRDADTNSGPARDSHTDDVTLPTHSCVDSHIDRRQREADACTRVYNCSLEVAK